MFGVLLRDLNGFPMVLLSMPRAGERPRELLSMSRAGERPREGVWVLGDRVSDGVWGWMGFCELIWFGVS